MNVSYSTASWMEKYVGPLKNKGPVSNHIPWAKKIADFYNPMFILSFFQQSFYTNGIHCFLLTIYCYYFYHLKTIKQ